MVPIVLAQIRSSWQAPTMDSAILAPPRHTQVRRQWPSVPRRPIPLLANGLRRLSIVGNAAMP